MDLGCMPGHSVSPCEDCISMSLLARHRLRSHGSLLRAFKLFKLLSAYSSFEITKYQSFLNLPALMNSNFLGEADCVFERPVVGLQMIKS